MRYAGLIKNDFSAAPGVSVSFYTQGCPHHCEGCHNPETWDFDGGKEFTHEVLNEIIEALQANGINRSFCILGGEPLCPQNEFLTTLVIKTVKDKLPDTKIYLWTGYVYEGLSHLSSAHIKTILSNIDYLIDGPYIEAQRDITLPMRGSRNQRVIEIDKSSFL
jgi:anaerobic ribonucleoside-triphosphate reductase activating protein